MSIALVTGGSRGLGRAIAIQLVKDLGYHIIINYTSNDEAAKETVSLIEALGGTCEAIKFNVGSKDEVEEAITTWENNNPDKFIEILVNNAGITRDGMFMWMKEEDWDDVLNVSVKGFFNVTQRLISKMLRKRKGKVVNVASLSGLKGVAGQTNYSAAKGAMISATKALAQEVAKRSITVNAIAPGFIKSDMTKDLDETELKKLVPLNRFGEAEEVAHLVSFLASNKANYITGEVININGGIYS